MEQNRSSQFDNLIANEICKICDADRYYLLVPYPGLAIGYLIIRKQGSMINRNVVGDRDTLLWYCDGLSGPAVRARNQAHCLV